MVHGVRWQPLRAPLLPAVTIDREGLDADLADNIERKLAVAVTAGLARIRAQLADPDTNRSWAGAHPYDRTVTGHAPRHVPARWSRIGPMCMGVLLAGYSMTERTKQGCASLRNDVIDHLTRLTEATGRSPDLATMFDEREMRLSTETWATRASRRANGVPTMRSDDGALNYRSRLRSLRADLATMVPELVEPRQPKVANDTRWKRPVEVADNNHFLATLQAVLAHKPTPRAGKAKSHALGVLLPSRGAGLDGTALRWATGDGITDPDPKGVVWVTWTDSNGEHASPALEAFGPSLLWLRDQRGSKLLASDKLVPGDQIGGRNTVALISRHLRAAHSGYTHSPSPSMMQAAWIREMLLRGVHPVTLCGYLGTHVGQIVWRVMLSIDPDDYLPARPLPAAAAPDRHLISDLEHGWSQLGATRWTTR